MRVETDIKAGNLVDDAVNVVSSTYNQVADFVSKADSQAQSVVGQVESTANAVWQSVTNPFS